MSHLPVLLKEAVDGLQIEPEGFYIDGTFGRGGHSREILAKLNADGRLLVFDKDPVAIKTAELLAAEDSRVIVHHGSFTDMEAVVSELDLLNSVDGILLDLGVSSPQLDEARRGFSFIQDGPLDMRMNTAAGQTAEYWLIDVDEKTLADVLYQYGEERHSRRIAKAIVLARKNNPFTTTLQLAEVIKAAHPRWPQHQHPATKSFQAIRIFINKELDDLKQVLPQTLNILKPNGRMSVISFHSLEDRMVKKFVLNLQNDPRFPVDMAAKQSEYHVPIRAVGKMIKASQGELDNNPRARSACLRIMEKQ